ncbi:MAG: DUF4058 family protein, partial [Chloroflexi bacterium]|nr:DUF4058 family protein [Chloroflexota bacterium]
MKREIGDRDTALSKIRATIQAAYLEGLEVAMPSPFPGMDPYLEGSLWTTVHFGLSAE